MGSSLEGGCVICILNLVSLEWPNVVQLVLRVYLFWV